ncbi:MAG: gamma-glutamylcyclotransferase family protein [Sphaerochaetaceae bacterium]|jgi:gamma-glutamylcyclotransferase (GGCT)/AIG2-like uncharacterized protein YtfP
MKTKRKTYLAYGSNMNLDQMEWRCPNAAVQGTSTLHNWALTFRGPRRDGVATIEKKEGFNVGVLLWSITDECEQSLDRYEGYPHLYHKETVTVTLDGDEIEAMVYIMNDVYPYAIPGPYYYKTLVDGYADCGFDKALLDEAIELTARKNHD